MILIEVCCSFVKGVVILIVSFENFLGVFWYDGKIGCVEIVVFGCCVFLGCKFIV